MAEKTKKLSFGGKIKKFFKDYKSEFKKVTWYGKEQTLKSTLIVLVLVVALAVVIGGLDFLFYKGINLLGGIFA
ncbi:MAG: preprotein translocase subunit SecE [Clostridiales bacterium]|nr:preprotein translocase subunit SecE [Clostridiales bacterium]